MPAATPIPRGPSVLTLYSAADLLTGHGCPACRYAGEATDRYLAWFALEGHAQPNSITRLRASLGMCPRHTRKLMSQPGAAIRLTAVSRYLMRAAHSQLTGRAQPRRGCPACEREDTAAGRALDTLLEGLASGPVHRRYRELGGLCIPHLRTASRQAGGRLAGWLADQAMAAATDPPPAGPRWLAGTDHDAETRAALRAAVPASPPASTPGGADGCAACQAAARAERAQLAQRADSQDAVTPAGDMLLCAGHLSDLAVLAGQDGMQPVLAWQAACLAASLSRRPGLRASWMGISGSRLRLPGRPAGRGLTCVICLHVTHAVCTTLAGLRVVLRAAPPATSSPASLCVRHLLIVRATDPRAARAATPGAIRHADLLITELDEAFRKNTWAHRHEQGGPEMTAWRRAASFLDGGVPCGLSSGLTRAGGRR